MGESEFNPDQYLAEKGGDNSSFNPDQYLAEKGGFGSAFSSPSWLDTSIAGHTPRGAIQSTLNALPMVGMVAGGVAGLPEGGFGAIPGAALGAAGGEAIKNIGERYLLGQDKTRSDIYGGPALAAVSGAENEMGGRIIGAGIKAAGETPAGKYVSGKVGDAANWAIKKAVKVFASVPEDVTERYLENPLSINNAIPINTTNEQIMSLRNHTEEALQKAKDELDAAKSAATNTKFDTQADLNSAQNDLRDKTQSYREALKSSNLTSLASTVDDAAGDLKKQVYRGSSAAYDILDAEKGSVKTEPLVKMLQGHIDGLKINDVAIPGFSSQSVNEIEQMKASLTKMGDSISLPQAKQLMQGLDIDYSGNPNTTFTDAGNSALKDLRHAIDTSVKAQSEPYRLQMEEVARKAKLLSALNDGFGSTQSTISKLNNIDSEVGKTVHKPLLDALGKETGHDLSSPINDFIAKQKIIESGQLFQTIMDASPEAQKVLITRAKMDALKNPSHVSSGVSSAQAKIEKATGDYNLFKGITNDSITGKTKSLSGANHYGSDVKFGDIDERYGTNFKKQIQNRNDLEAFSKDNTRGSRNASIFGGIGTGLGYTVGGEHGAVAGYAAGKVVGGVVDKYAGPIAKYGIDAGRSAVQAPGIILNQAPSLVGKGVLDNTRGYSDGGIVVQNDQQYRAPSSSDPKDNSNATYIDKQKAKEAQDSLRKAFHFATGGMVPGENSPEKDTVLAKLSPGEVVLPLSVTQSSNPPQRAKDFMANELLKNGQQINQQQDPAQAQLIQQAQTPSPRQQMDPEKGPDKWAFDGFQNLIQHVPDNMKDWLHENRAKILLDPKAKNLLITASTFKPGSKPLDDVVKHLQTRFEGKK